MTACYDELSGVRLKDRKSGIELISIAGLHDDIVLLARMLKLSCAEKCLPANRISGENAKCFWVCDYINEILLNSRT